MESSRWPTLLEQFMREECTDDGRERLHAALRTRPARASLNFNRFDVMIDHEAGVVFIEDVLPDAEPTTQRLTLAEFRAALDQTTPKA